MTIILNNSSKVYRVNSHEIVKAVAKEIVQYNKVQAIEFVRSAFDIGLNEAKAFVENLNQD